MSYIRCLSNPERLYVYGSIHGIEWCGAGFSVTLPEEEFIKFVLKERKTCYDVLEHGDFKIFKTEDFKRELQYKGKTLAVMWDVTWAYIANSIIATHEWEKKRTEKTKTKKKP